MLFISVRLTLVSLFFGSPHIHCNQLFIILFYYGHNFSLRTLFSTFYAYKIRSFFFYLYLYCNFSNYYDLNQKSWWFTYRIHRKRNLKTILKLVYTFKYSVQFRITYQRIFISIQNLRTYFQCIENSEVFKKPNSMQIPSHFL